MRRVHLTPDAFPDRALLRGFEGGAVFTAERDHRFYVMQDEGTLADFLSHEDLVGVELTKVLEFETAAERSAYIRKRGWSSPDDG